MTIKPRGRAIKKQVEEILKNFPKKDALELLTKIPDSHLTAPLFAHLYHSQELIKFRSATAMGHLAARICDRRREEARIILRRIMWNLNDESGGIGWGSPEAMGDILACSKELAGEFGSILFSYLDTGGNFIEHEILQRGVIWGIGTYLKKAPETITPLIRDQLVQYLDSPDAIKRAYSLRALKNAGQEKYAVLPQDSLTAKNPVVSMYMGWNWKTLTLSDLLCP